MLTTTPGMMMMMMRLPELEWFNSKFIYFIKRRLCYKTVKFTMHCEARYVLYNMLSSRYFNYIVSSFFNRRQWMLLERIAVVVAAKRVAFAVRTTSSSVEAAAVEHK